MDRRDFLRISGMAPLGYALSTPLATAFAQAVAPGDRWKIYEVTHRVEVLKPSGATRIWLPTPLTDDTPYHKSLGSTWNAEGGSAAFSEDPKYGAGIVSAEFPAGARPVLTMTSRFATRDVAVDLSRPGNAPAEDRAELRKYTAATELMPTDGIVKKTSSEIVRGKRGDLEKARAIYDWVVDNTARDPKTRGCGTGDIKFMLENNALSGKCADLNALYVALMRAEGIPARDVYGIRVAGSALGYNSLGRTGGDITKAQHCRAEFYLPTHGWVPVDPADVRKVILEEGGGKAPNDPMVLAARKRLFGSWEMNWLAYNYAHDVALPGSTRGKVPFFMYPQSETAEGRLDSLDPDNFKYTISAKEVA
ncbi:MAG TPA: transglutaminase domain-containing protein [Usitatibacter sp.]|nr:transglutaminase domain-containing protein [Usitatibacter sp.]